MLLSIVELIIGILLLVFVYVYIKGLRHFSLSRIYGLSWGMLLSIEVGLYSYSQQTDLEGRLPIILVVGLNVFALFCLLNDFTDRDGQEWKKFINTANFWFLTVTQFTFALLWLFICLK
jgi:hypothetical protein